MKQLFKAFIIFLILTTSGCDSLPNSNEQIATVEEESRQVLFDKYKGAYVGDNSSVGGILYGLDITNDDARSANGFQLFTDKPPYGILINYDWTTSEHQYKETSAYYATYLFTLIRNADFVTFNYTHDRYTVTKEALIAWYGQDFTDISSDEELQIFLRDNFDADRLDELFNTINEDERVTAIFISPDA